MNAVTFRGPSAQVRWGYHTAADLGAWEVSGNILTATVVKQDVTRVAQQPLTFVVPRPKGAWVWTIESLQISGASLIATIVP